MESISFWVVPAEVASEAEEPSELLVESEPEVELLPELPPMGWLEVMTLPPWSLEGDSEGS